MPGASLDRAELYVAAVNKCLYTFRLDTPVRMAAFLAQVGHESASLRYTSELASGHAYTGRADLGNTDSKAIALARAGGEDTGPFYKGHGLIQITGYTNHLAYSRWMYGDARCAHKPLLLTEVPDAVLSAGWFWNSRKLSELADLNTDDAFRIITRRINGGTNGMADRKTRWKLCKKVFDVRG